MNLESINSIYPSVKASELFGRYITNSHIEIALKKAPKSMVSVLGYSVEHRPIYGLRFGTGATKVFLWSQMHGNESTTTKALFDCFNLFETPDELSKSILGSCTILVIPILNPDGAERYTRANANGVDLNRDAQDLSQPESAVLQTVYKDFKPDYCFNLHGQRTIFGAGTDGVSATLSFLSPAQDVERVLTPNRKIAMAIIAEVNTVLQNEIPNGVGRYDDGYNLNCVGDTFQSLGVPTLLFEAGHYSKDYEREEVRRHVFLSILKGLEVISKGVNHTLYQDYFKIPENAKCFYDLIIRNAKLQKNEATTADIGIQYQEVLEADAIDFKPKVEIISQLEQHFGHKEIDANGFMVKKVGNLTINIGDEIDFVLLNNQKILLKP